MSAELHAREFEFDDSDFDALRTLAKQITGICLADSKRELLYGRVSRRVRARGLTSFAAYRKLLQAGGPELVHFCNAMTTNLTSFFREEHHFEHLREDMFTRPPPRPARRIRIWSAACSSGEEAYSIAMTVIEALPQWREWDIKILATDLDSDMVARAASGRFSADRMTGLRPDRLARFFAVKHDGRASSYQVDPDVARLITFKQLNLTHALPMTGPLDAIFCRNVVIYFDKDTQRALFARLARLQQPGGLLFLGHSEMLSRMSQEYALLGRTTYRRK